MQKIHRSWMGGLAALVLGSAFAAACSSDGSSDSGGSGGSSSGGDTSLGGEGNPGGMGGLGNTGGTVDGSGGGAGEGGGGAPSRAPVRTVAVPGATNLYGLTYSASGKVYVSGTKTVGGEPMVGVWRYDEDGVLDTTFGDSGVALHNLGTGTESSYGVVELANGDVVVQGTHGGKVYLLKFDDEGSLVLGPVYVQFGWSLADLGDLPDPDVWDSNTAPSYTSWGITLDTSGDEEKLVVSAFGAPKRGEVDGLGKQRLDADRWVARVLASTFAADTSFNGGEALGVDVDGANQADNARRVLVEADGTIVQAGYTNFGSGNEVVLMRVKPDGTLDASFGFGTVTDHGGLTRFNPFTGPNTLAEAYALVKGTNRYVTTGYGKANFEGTTSIENDLVSFGVLLDGSGLDEDGYGADGAWAVMSENDPVAQMGTWQGGRAHRENGRDLVLLPGGRTLHVGCYNDYAAVFMFRASAGLDEDFGNNGMIVFDGASEYATIMAPFFKAALSSDGTTLATSGQSGHLAFFDLD